MRLHLLVFVQMWGLCRSLDIDLVAYPLPGPGNRLSGFTRYACEIGVRVFREQQRASSVLVPLSYWPNQQCIIWPSNENTRYAIPTVNGLMGAADGSAQKRKNTRYLIPTVVGLWVLRMGPHNKRR